MWCVIELVNRASCVRDEILVCVLQKGQIQEQKNEFLEAKQSYQNAVSLNPGHVPSLQQLVGKSRVLIVLREAFSSRFDRFSGSDVPLFGK